MADQVAALVDRIGALDMGIKSAKKALAALTDERAALVETLEGMVGQQSHLVVNGLQWRATVVKRATVTFPTKSADAMRTERFKGDLRGAGLWDLVSEICYPRVKSLWNHPKSAPELFRRVAAPYANESSSLTVRCQPAGNRVEARSRNGFTFRSPT